jgi:hypothetical protein
MRHWGASFQNYLASNTPYKLIGRSTVCQESGQLRNPSRFVQLAALGGIKKFIA